jgi:hypothetical protein
MKYCGAWDELLEECFNDLSGNDTVGMNGVEAFFSAPPRKITSPAAANSDCRGRIACIAG